MPKPDAIPAGLPKPLVMIADDMSIVREPISVCLQKAGYETVLAADEAQVLQQMQSRVPDLILLDIHLGKTDGLTLLNEIRERPGGDKIPVILLTVETNAQFVVRASKLGIRDYLLKTRFSLDELLVRVGKYLRAPLPAQPTAPASAPARPAAGNISREKTIERAQNALSGRTLSGALAQVITMASAPGTSMAQLAPIISRDVMLSANVLRVANSAAYSTSKSAINTIPEAIRQIGCSTVGQIAAAIAVIDCLPESTGGAFNPIRAWQHSFAVAKLCHQLTPSDDASHGVAYLVGLCHDLTDILFHTHFACESELIFKTMQETGQCRAEVERAVLGMTQSQLVPIVLEKIGLPQTIREPIVEFYNAAGPGTLPKGALACRLWIAELYANSLLLAASPSSTVTPLTVATCKRAGVDAQTPPCADTEALRAEVFSLTAMLARLSPKQDVSYSQPLLPRQQLRIWLARDPAFCPLDPLATALHSLADASIHNRLPTAAESESIAGIIVATQSPAGCSSMPADTIQAVSAASARPLLWLASGSRSSGDPTQTLPVSLADLQQFISNTQAAAVRPAA